MKPLKGGLSLKIRTDFLNGVELASARSSYVQVQQDSGSFKERCNAIRLAEASPDQKWVEVSDAGEDLTRGFAKIHSPTR